MRINQFLARAGLGSRRKVEEIILAGRVKCNGKTVTDLGRQIDPLLDKLEFEGNRLKLGGDGRLVALFKPAGFLTSKEDKHHEKTIFDLLEGEAKNFNYAGRLDLGSRGLLLLSDDGNLIQKLTHPRYKMEKEYEVTIQKRAPWKRLAEEFKLGVREGGETLRVKLIEPIFEEGMESEETSRFRIVLEEGKKRQIRRMFHSKNFSVIDLIRVRIGTLKLSDLKIKEGEFTYLDPDLVYSLRKPVSFTKSKGKAQAQDQIQDEDYED